MANSVDSKMNSVEGAMKKCLICNSSPNREQIPYCQICGWPTGVEAAMPKDVNLYQAVLAWAKMTHQENLHLKSIDNAPVSAMNAQLQEVSAPALVQNPPDLELLQAELANLSSRIKTIEDNQNQRGLESVSLSDKDKIVKDIQVLTKAVRDTSDFLDQQNSHNQILYEHKQSSEKVLAEYGRMLQNLMKAQQHSGEISGAKNALSGSLSQSFAIGAPAGEIRSIKAANSPSGVGNSVSKEADLLKEYNSNSQEVPKSLRDNSKNVSIADDAVVRIRDGNESNITFKLNRSGNFFIISRGGYCYLVPNKQRRIIPQMFTITQAIYKCGGYSENYQDFRLMKPALVSEEPGDCWKLSQKGILEFT
jgi:hypothetical protein